LIQEARVFTLDVHPEPDHLLLQVGGELDLHSKPMFRERLTELLQQARQPIIIDLSDLEFIDSSGLGVLLAIARLPEGSRPRVVVTRRDGPVRRLLRTTHLDILLDIYPSVEAARSGAMAAGSAA
jgi:anti-sigma B factor antagonist